MSYVTAETATVYRAPNGRRYLTKAAAYRKAAWALMRKDYSCECEADVGFVCGICKDDALAAHVEKVKARLARWLARADRTAESNTEDRSTK